MTVSLLLALLVTLSGTIATYLYDDNATLGARLCSGVCLGLAALGLAGFVVASVIGLSGVAVLLSAAICCSPLALITDATISRRFKQDLQNALRAAGNPGAKTIGYFLFYLVIGLVFWKVFDRAVIEDNTGLSTGLLNNFGDLPFHISVITSFAYGNNFPPEDPTYAGVRFTYPFISDFVSSMFLRCGADLRQSMFVENYLLAISFIGLVHRWALEMLRDKLAAAITPLIVILSGGLGWVLLFDQARADDGGLWGALMNLAPSFTVIPETTWRWGNAVSALLVPQRGFLMGLPLAVLAFTQWWLATEKETPKPPERTKKKGQVAKEPEPVRFPISQRRMIAAGVAAGLLPLVHAHSFVVVMGMAACLALLFVRWRDWITFFVVASAIAVPQLAWSTWHSAVNAGTFFAFELGWDRGQDNPIWFWFKNTGFFIPLILAAVLFKSDGFLVRRRLLLFYLPFTLCFIIPNFVKMAPWIWDNIKVLYYWWLASAPLVALLLSKLWQQGPIRKVVAVILFVVVTLAGALDVASIALRSPKFEIFSSDGLAFAKFVMEKTPPRALVMHAPVHNTPIFLTGRRSLMGYPGHIWTHGLQFVQREGEIRRIYLGSPDAAQLLKFYNVDYAVVGPQERMVIQAINERFFSQFEKVGQVGEYSLYKINPQ
ncbi:MAG TPA: hypothetical protein VFY61_15480 [Pyrinomonadaceae bacterium]|nr:hypothetical protein [Pyrinomonadaceae bacterium]